MCVLKVSVLEWYLSHPCRTIINGDNKQFLSKCQNVYCVICLEIFSYVIIFLTSLGTKSSRLLCAYLF